MMQQHVLINLILLDGKKAFQPVQQDRLQQVKPVDMLNRLGYKDLATFLFYPNKIEMLVTLYQVNKPVISFDASPFDTVRSMLENINKYRGPENQIRVIYLDAERKKKATPTSWLLFNTIFYVEKS